MARGWHSHKDAMAAKSARNLAYWSRFQLAWDRKHNSMQALPNLALADGPAPLLRSNMREEMEARPAPPRGAGSANDGVLRRRRWGQGTRATANRLMARMDEMQRHAR